MKTAMRIAVASGKGGTGKTTIATNLAAALCDQGERVAYLDCDVEEPNGHLFLHPDIHQIDPVTIAVPEVISSACTHCGACARACRFGAMLVAKDGVTVFPQLCHACGGCLLACPAGALFEVPRRIGVVERGTAGQIEFGQGILDVGQTMAPPIIRKAIGSDFSDHILVVDVPPGTSCPVVESIKTADAVLLVTEPTPFGLHDLRLAVDVVRTIGLPFGVVVNRAGMGDHGVFDFCERQQIPILLQIPDDRQIAEAYSRGELAIHVRPELKSRFVGLLADLRALKKPLQSPPTTPSITSPGVTSCDPPVAPTADVSNTEPLSTAPVRELVVISGKGGTGKTSIVSSFFALATNAVVADCDVDAPDLHLVVQPTIRARHPFSGAHEAVIDTQSCAGCGLCAKHCRFDAISLVRSNGRQYYEVDDLSCEGCGVCADLCPESAIKMVPAESGEWFVSDTRFGPMVHALLGVAQETSGKLVSLVRKEAKAVARRAQRELLICDGSPGIGCPVVASITGAQLALIVTEPTLSGLHDLRRVAELTQHFDVPSAVCINKVDINLDLAEKIEKAAAEFNIPVLGRIRYDPAITKAQLSQRSVVETTDSGAAKDIRSLWDKVSQAFPPEEKEDHQ